MKATFKLFIVSIALFLFSCTKQTVPAGVGAAPVSTAQAPTFYAISFVDSTGIAPNNSGNYYNTSAMGNSFTITANGIPMPYNGNYYAYSNLGKTSGGNTNWIINGSAFSGGFSFTSKACPVIQPIKFSSISLSSNYTISNSTITADQIVYTISNGVSSLTKTFYGTATGAYFTKAELNSIFNSLITTAGITIQASNIVSNNALGTNYLFVSQTDFYNGNVHVNP